MPAVALAIFLFSLTGLPPFAGFVGKFYLFAAGDPGAASTCWSLIGVLNSVVSLYYYARIVRAMFLDQPAAGDAPVALPGRPTSASSACCRSATTFLVIQFGWLLADGRGRGRVFTAEA